MAESCPVVRFVRDTSMARIDGTKISSGIGDPNDRSEFAEESFGSFYVICILLSMVSYVLDMGMACVLLYCYAQEGPGANFALTLTFVLISAIITTTVSLRWYIVDHDHSVGRTSLFHWVVRIIFLLLQLTPLLRYADTLIYGLRSKYSNNLKHPQHRIQMYRRMLDEDTNAALLRLFHCFLHASPQAVIQLMIVLRKYVSIKLDVATAFNDTTNGIQLWTVLLSLLSIGWSLAVYHRSIRCSRDDKINIDWTATTMAFFWQFLSALSRVLALSILGAIFPIWMTVICCLHWAMMSICVSLNQQHATTGCNRCEELLLAVGLGIAYIFAFISPRDGPTRYVYLAYYLVCFMENTGALVVWCVTNNSTTYPLLYYGAVCAQVLTFLSALIFMFIYYNWCHPSHKNGSKMIKFSDMCLDLEKPSISKSYTVKGHS